MKIKILDKTENEVHIEFEGENHTLLNLLKIILLEFDGVLMATYDARFPAMTNPIFRLKTEGVDPVEIMIEAANEIESLCREFGEQFEEAVE